MPIIMPPVDPPTSDTWATLEFGSYYLKEHPEAAPTQGRGVVQSDLTFGEIRSQNWLEPQMIMFYPEETVAAWTGADIPPLVKDWATELAAAYALHAAAASGRLDRAKEFEEWIERIKAMILEHLRNGWIIQDPDGQIITARVTPIDSPTKGPVSSFADREEVFTDEVIEEMVEVHSRRPRAYTSDAEVDDYPC